VSFEFNETLHPEHGGFIHGDWRRRRGQSGTFLLEKCCHDIDLSIWFSGKLPVRVASFGGLNFFVPGQAHQAARIGPDKDGRAAYRTWFNPNGVDPFAGDQDIFDNQVAILEFAGGIRATFHTNCNAAIMERRFYILGTEGAIRADARSGIVEVARIGHGELVERLGTGSTDGHSGGDEVMAEHLEETLLSGRPPAAGLAEAVNSLVACGGIDRACDEQRVVDLAPAWAELGIDPGSPAGAAGSGRGW
jgi:predicted dehydrogenase